MDNENHYEPQLENLRAVDGIEEAMQIIDLIDLGTPTSSPYISVTNVGCTSYRTLSDVSGKSGVEIDPKMAGLS